MPVYQSATAEFTGLALNSWSFFLVAVLAIILSAFLKQKSVRNIALLGVNLYVLAAFGTGMAAFATLGVFLGAVYVIGLWRKKQGNSFSLAAQLSIVAGLWVYLFLVRDPALLAPANPFYFMPIYIIGISYMTFRAICYIMEVEFIEKPSFLSFCSYVLFFPGLIAGPIERYRSFEGQLAKPEYNSALVLDAFHRIANGMIEKFVIADNLSVFGAFAITDVSDVSSPMLWLGTLMQLWLIYMDFSGYCDIVIGIAMLMGFRMMENFNEPFRSVSIQEFWNRWHISLSTLVRDYIFTPINMMIIKGTKGRMQFALITIVYFFSMILIGLWHGVTWGFAVFGTIHGGALVASQLIKKKPKKISDMGVIELRLRQFLVYAFLSTTLILWMKSADEWGLFYGKMLGVY